MLLTCWLAWIESVGRALSCETHGTCERARVWFLLPHSSLCSRTGRGRSFRRFRTEPGRRPVYVMVEVYLYTKREPTRKIRFSHCSLLGNSTLGIDNRKPASSCEATASNALQVGTTSFAIPLVGLLVVPRFLGACVPYCREVLLSETFLARCLIGWLGRSLRRPKSGRQSHRAIMEHRASCLNVSILNRGNTSSMNAASSGGEPSTGALLQKAYRKRRMVRDRYDESQDRLASLRALERASTTSTSSSAAPNLDAQQQHPSPPPPPLTRVPAFWVTTWSRNVIGSATISSSRRNTNHRGSRNSDSQQQRRSTALSAPTRTTTTTTTDNEGRQHDENDTTRQ
jgi:hypothetical protein